MKTRVILLLMIPLFWNSSVCQNQYQIADTTKKWNNLVCGVGSFMVICCCHTYTDTLSGDTILNADHYYKIFESDDSAQMTWVLRGFLRESLPDHKVYFRNLYGNEGLLYNFSLVPYDTVTITNAYYGGTPYTVNLTCYIKDSVLVNGSYRSRYFLGHPQGSGGYSYADTWIDGIGSLWGIFHSGGPPPGGLRKLLCYSESDSVIYINPSYNVCFKDEFYPKILSDKYDTAYINTYYEFHIQISDTTANDTIGWIGWTIPGGFTLDIINGILYGVSNAPGIYPCTISVKNRGYGTDVLEGYLPVVSPLGTDRIKSSEEINLYPNPSHGVINLKLKPNISGYKYSIFSLSGKKIEENRLINSSIQFDYKALPKGKYLISIYNFDTNTEITQTLILH